MELHHSDCLWRSGDVGPVTPAHRTVCHGASDRTSPSIHLCEEQGDTVRSSTSIFHFTQSVTVVITAGRAQDKGQNEVH